MNKKYSAEEVFKKWQKAEQEHSKFVTLYSEVYKYGMPERYGNIQRTEKGVKGTDDVFTSVFENAFDSFVQKMQSFLTPVHNDWIALETGVLWDVKEDLASRKKAVNESLSKIASILNVFKDNSNFDKAMSQFFYELGAGTGVLLILKGDEQHPMRFISIPFKDISMLEGPFGTIDTYFRTLTLRNEVIPKQWDVKNFTFQETEKDKERKLLEATYYDDESKKWIYQIYTNDDKKLIYEDSSETSPFVEFRWNKITGETYGRGQGLKALADVKTLNLLTYYSLLDLSFTLPVYTVKQDSIDTDTFSLEPGSLNAVISNDKNDPPVSAIPMNQQPDLQQYEMSRLAMNIKKTMYSDSLPDDPSRDTKATEIRLRARELADISTNSFGTAVEFIYRIVARMIEILASFGYIKGDEDSFSATNLNGIMFRIKLNSNIANQQASEEVQNVLQAVQFMQSLDPTLQYTSKVLNINKLAPYILERLGVKPEFIRNEEEIAAMEQQEAQAMQMQQQQALQDEVAVSNAKEEGKAAANGR